MHTAQKIFHAACCSGEDDLVRSFLFANASAIELEGKNSPGGRTPLLEVCWEGHTTIAEFLISLGANVHAKDAEDFACLHAAAYHGHVEIINLLLDAGADIECLDDGRSTPFAVAAVQHRLAAMRLLAKRGAEISPVAQEGITPLNMACCQASVPRVRLLLKLGADPGRPADVGCLLQIVSCMPSLAPLLDEENGQREEREALMHRQLAIAEMLIAAGIDLDVRVRDNPVIHIAAMVDSRRLMAALLRAGARCYIYAPAVNGIADTPLLRAAGYANPAIVHLLLQAGALETTWDQSGRLPLEVVGRFSDKHAPRPKGVLRRREEATRRELLRGPAFRARSWAWPDV
ncbi:unnamed protein product, partial [Scytosiphon promiscuus]